MSLIKKLNTATFFILALLGSTSQTFAMKRQNDSRHLNNPTKAIAGLQEITEYRNDDRYKKNTDKLNTLDKILPTNTTFQPDWEIKMCEIGTEIGFKIDTLINKKVSSKAIIRLLLFALEKKSDLDLQNCAVTTESLELIIQTLKDNSVLPDNLNILNGCIKQVKRNLKTNRMEEVPAPLPRESLSERVQTLNIMDNVIETIPNNISLLTNLKTLNIEGRFLTYGKTSPAENGQYALPTSLIEFLQRAESINMTINGLDQTSLLYFLNEAITQKNKSLIRHLLDQYEFCFVNIYYTAKVAPEANQVLGQNRLMTMLSSIGSLRAEENEQITIPIYDLINNGVSIRTIIRLLKDYLSTENELVEAALNKVHNKYLQANNKIKETVETPSTGSLKNSREYTYPQTISEWVKSFKQTQNTFESIYPIINQSIANKTENHSPLMKIPVTLECKTIKEMLEKITEYYNDELAQEKNWCSQTSLDTYQKSTGKTQRLLVEENSRICFMGDIHGSIHSLLRNLLRLTKKGYLNDNFELIQNQDHPFYMIFLGDYIERGRWSVEVLHILMTLKIKNPHNVFLLRGNHEQDSIFNQALYGFPEELTIKYGTEKDALQKAYNTFFTCLPLALYLGVQGDQNKNFIQCCHGGIAQDYTPTNLLLADENENIMFDQIPWVDQSKRPIWMGFTYNDFNYNKGTLYASARSLPKPTYIISVEDYLETLNGRLKPAKVHAFFRGHQHENFGLKLKGGKHWDVVVPPQKIDHNGFPIVKFGPVFTFSTAREGAWLPYDCFGILTVAKDYDQWFLQPNEYKLDDTKDLGFTNIPNIEDGPTKAADEQSF